MNHWRHPCKSPGHAARGQAP